MTISENDQSREDTPVKEEIEKCISDFWNSSEEVSEEEDVGPLKPSDTNDLKDTPQPNSSKPPKTRLLQKRQREKANMEQMMSDRKDIVDVIITIL